MTSSNHDQTDDAAAIYNKSLDRCVAHAGFLDRFYELLLNSSDEIREKFRNTDFARQKEVLKDTLYIMMSVDDWSVGCDSHLEEIAHRHSRSDLDTRPELYDVWLDCLIQAVREHDPLCNAVVEAAWRKALEPGIAFMRSHY